MFKSLIAVAAIITAAAPAAAALDVGANGDTTGVPFFQVTQTFNVNAAYVGTAQLNIGLLNADDLIVVTLNGIDLVGAGIFGPGNGNVFFTAAGPSTPFFFAYGNGTVNASFGGFVAGLNTLTYTINNNNAGINAGNGPLTGGPGSYSVDATVTVPEPATWALMIGGFGLTGLSMRRRKTALKV